MTTRPTLESIGGELAKRLSKTSLRAIIKLELRGQEGGVLYLRLNGKVEIAPSIAGDERPDVIVGADAQTLEALLSGRMKVSDGLVSERLSLAGDVSRIVAFKEAVLGGR